MACNANAIVWPDSDVSLACSSALVDHLLKQEGEDILVAVVPLLTSTLRPAQAESASEVSDSDDPGSPADSPTSTDSSDRRHTRRSQPRRLTDAGDQGSRTFESQLDLRQLHNKGCIARLRQLTRLPKVCALHAMSSDAIST